MSNELNIAVAEILEGAATPIRLGMWCKNVPARDSNYGGVFGFNKNACFWCALGAISEAADELKCSDLSLEKAIAALPKNVAIWNDCVAKDHIEVADTMDRAAWKLRNKK
jgi:hypothetical protein